MALLIVAMVILVPGCGPRKIPPPGPPGTQKPYSVFGRTYYPLTEAEGYQEEGMASWYGRPFHGRRTASGEKYNMYALTAAHRILPLGTHVRVTNLQNQASIQVRINDRGPFVRGRIIDLSFAAAQKIGLVGPGVAPVRVVVLGQPIQPGGEAPPFKMGPFTIQVGAFTDLANARRLAERLESRYGPGTAQISRFNDGTKTYHRVRAFSLPDRSSAEAKLTRLAEDGFGVGFVVAVD